jgi:hypothetical protein
VKPSVGKVIMTVGTTVVAVSIIAGVILVGSPAEGRREQLDSTRVEDLKRIMSATDSFWERNARLPESLEELTEDARAEVSNVDPGSAEPYDYVVSGEESYELCATFDGESTAPVRSSADFWRHGAGRQCFELTVDTSG